MNVKFLRTKEIVEEIEKLTRTAKEEIIIVSPYVKVDKNIAELMSEAKKERNVEVTIVYGKKKLPPKEKEKLNGMNINIYFRDNLHAKCYMNEEIAIVTSMNLYDYSAMNNEEFGIMIPNFREDKQVYDSIKEEVERIIRNSKKEEAPKPPDKQMGHCIRCGKEIELDPLTPYCKSCYVSWAKYKNPDYEEKYCHICGMPYKSTMNKPVCKTCWTKYKDKLNFPSAKKKK